MSFDLKQWLSGLELTDEQRTQVESALANEKNQQKLKNDFLRQSDYSRNLDQIRQKEEQLTSYESQLAAWKAEADRQLEAERQQRQQAELQAFRLRQVAQEYGVDTTEYETRGLTQSAAAGAGTQSAAATAQAPTFDPNQYVSREELNRTGNQFTLLPAMIADINARHQELYGKPATGMQTLVQEALNKRIPLEQAAEERFKFSEKQQEIDAQARAAEHERIRQEERTRVLSEMHLPTAPRRADAGSPVLARPFNQPADPNQPTISAVDAAVQAINEGRYAPQG